MNKILKKALSGVVEFEDKPSTPKKPPVTPINLSAQTIDKGDLDKFHEHFDALLKQANLPGPDYYEFSKIEATLKAPIPDEHVRITTAFASLQTQSPVTKDVIVNSAQTYVEVIKKDKEGFQKALEEKQKVEVESRKKQIESLNQKIATAKQQIDELNASIVQSSTSIQKFNTELTDIESNLHKNEGAYLTACDDMISKINSDIEKIKSNL
jgi:chromosome segregation ATPase